MIRIRKLHEEAMDLAEMAFVTKLRGDLGQADQLFWQAYENEAQAARLVPDEPSSEPTRSILYRSAASLALDCNELRESERLIASGLAGHPPEEIAKELRELFEEVKSQRSLLLEQRETLILELRRIQEENRELSEKIRIIERLLPDDRSKMERALYRNPLESIAMLLMVGEKGKVPLTDAKEICQEKLLEVLYDCIKNDLVVDSDGGLTLTPLAMQYVSEWRRKLREEG